MWFVRVDQILVSIKNCSLAVLYDDSKCQLLILLFKNENEVQCFQEQSWKTLTSSDLTDKLTKRVIFEGINFAIEFL